MLAIFILKRESPKKHKLFIFSKGRYFVKGGPVNMNANLFLETSPAFLKGVILQLVLKYNQTYVNLNVKSSPKFNGP